MTNRGKYVDRNPDMRAAGLDTVVDVANVGNCLQIYSNEEVAKAWVNADCRKKELTQRGLLLKRTPVVHDNNVKDLLDVDRSKSRFMSFKEKFSEDMYFKKAKLGEVKSANTIPPHINNESRTFGIGTVKSDPLYEVVLPPKPFEQVNSDYGYFHEKYLISHNHYFPAEQINRKYGPPFDRRKCYGAVYNVDDNGRFVKRCLHHCDELVIVSKPQMDFLNRTKGPLGKKFKKYPYDVPQDMTHGVKTTAPDCDGKMLIENIDPCEGNKELVEAFSHLNKLRCKVNELPDFHINDLLTTLETYDEEKTGQLPLPLIFEVMFSYNLRPDTQKLRKALKHFNVLKDGVNSVNFTEFVSLLTLQKPLPKAGNISPMPKEVYIKDTTYRLMCQDMTKKPTEGFIEVHKMTPQQADNAITHVVDLITPSTPTKLGLGPSDFERLRDQQQIQRIFQNVIPADKFEQIWAEAIKNHADQNGMISVNQIRKMLSY